MKLFEPIQRISTKKQLREGLLVSFHIGADSYGYAIVYEGYGSMWLLDVYSKWNLFIPDFFPDKHAKWRTCQGFDKIDRDIWVLAYENELPARLTSNLYINRGMNGWQVNSREGLRPASEEDMKTIPISYGPDQIGVFAEERLEQLDLINGKNGWTAVKPEQLAKAQRPPRPKPTGEHRILVHVSDFNGTEILSRQDLEEDIQDEIKEHGFVSGGGSLVGMYGQEGGHVDIECSAEDAAAVIQGARRVLHSYKCSKDTVIVDITLMDDGTEKEKIHLLGVWDSQ